MMRKFLLRTALFCALPLPLLFALNHIVDHGLRQSNNSLFTEWNDIYSSRINADMLVVGASRAWVHISPAILDSVLHLNSYNIGIDGYPFEMQYVRFKAYMQHNKKPKYVLHSIEFSTFDSRLDLYQYQQFLPYLDDSLIAGVTSKMKGLGIMEYYFPLFKYNNEFGLISEGIRNYFGLSSPVPREKYKGYQGAKKDWDNTFNNFITKNPQGIKQGVDNSTVKLFEEYLAYCKQEDIQVIFVFTPQYHKLLPYLQNASQILAIFDRLSNKYDIPIYNYLDDSICYSKANFYNSLHMNAKGSEMFSKKLAADIRQAVNQPEL